MHLERGMPELFFICRPIIICRNYSMQESQLFVQILD